MTKFRLATALAGWILLAASACAAPTAEEVFPAEPDPLMGNYVGRWSADVEVAPNSAGQVIALGGDLYRVILVNELDMRCPKLMDIELKAKNGVIEFDQRPYSGKIDGKTFVGGRGKGDASFTMQKVERLSPTLGKSAPQGATVLFDGKNLDAWTDTKGWQILPDGTLMVTPDGEYIVSKGTWKDLEIHVEFRTPFMPRSSGQQRGNSGVFIQDVYEVQILDSFGLEGYYDECGALYRLSAPHVNACAPPLQWQTFDITYRAPRYDASGKLTENGRMTVLLNGVLVHNDQELKWITAWTEADRMMPPPKDPGHIKLQGHNNFVQFRNIWLVEK